MKKAFCICIFFQVFYCFSQFSFPGLGTESEPYQIWTAEHFQELAESTYTPSYDYWSKDKHIKLMNDIYLGNTIFGLGYWYGYFDGNGKTINREYESVICSYLGYYSMPFGVIDNLIVDGYAYTDQVYIAGIVCNNYGTISNCINNATVICTDDGSKYGLFPKGGIASTNSGTISNCINNGDITGVDRIGGITGENEGTIINCINTGNITATASGDNYVGGIGGIVGTCPNNNWGSISNCINLGTIIGTGAVGGIIGFERGRITPYPTEIINCINYGYVRGTNGVGGIIGYKSDQFTNVSNCVNVGVVEGDEYIGSIVGKE